jgi:hypothetical protein
LSLLIPYLLDFQRGIARKNCCASHIRRPLGLLPDSHPDSDYVPLAKFAIANAWYAEGGYQQAELEYLDFVTFFPNRPEVAQARTRIELIESGKK